MAKPVGSLSVGTPKQKDSLQTESNGLSVRLDQSDIKLNFNL